MWVPWLAAVGDLARWWLGAVELRDRAQDATCGPGVLGFEGLECEARGRVVGLDTLARSYYDMRCEWPS